jgi:hypothetical protein
VWKREWAVPSATGRFWKALLHGKVFHHLKEHNVQVDVVEKAKRLFGEATCSDFASNRVPIATSTTQHVISDIQHPTLNI